MRSAGDAEAVRILAVPGSLRRGSHTAALLRAAKHVAPASVRLVLYDGLREIPPYDEDHDRPDAPPAAWRLRRAIAAADAVMFSTPEYNMSIPGQLKNALDWASRPYPGNALRDKPVAVIGGSRGVFGAAWAQSELRHVLAAIGARVVDQGLRVPAVHRAFTTDDHLRDPNLRQRLEDIITLLADAAADGAADRAA